MTSVRALAAMLLLPFAAGANPETLALARLSLVSTSELELHELFPEIIPTPTWELAFEHDLAIVSSGGSLLIDGSGALSERGTLLPGRTQLLELDMRVHREPFVDEATGYGFTFAVPEPASAGLVFAGLTHLGWGSRRRTR
jgi:hypothetical protein